LEQCHLLADVLPAPEPPLWALEAGLPEPWDDESFCAYVFRLGLDPEPLLVELIPRTALLANLRLDSLLMGKMPGAFSKHVGEWSARVRGVAD